MVNFLQQYEGILQSTCDLLLVFSKAFEVSTNGFQVIKFYAHLYVRHIVKTIVKLKADRAVSYPSCEIYSLA